MMKKHKLYYKYRAFNSFTLESLCTDTIYFANPNSFNDPFDCSPTIECDSTFDELRQIFSYLFKNRTKTELIANLNRSKLKLNQQEEFIKNRVNSELKRKLSEIEYYSNDPEYDIPPKQVELNLLRSNIEIEISNYYSQGVSCFSSGYLNPLLWSHYGDQHNGICIGYSTNRDPIPEPKKVVYGGSRIIKSSMLVKAFLSGDVEAKSELDSAVLLRKAKEWKYEKESRLIDSQGIHESPFLLAEITFGLRCSDIIKHTLIQTLNGREKPIKYFEIYSERDSYSLKRRSLSDGDFESRFPITATSGYEAFADYIEVPNA